MRLAVLAGVVAITSFGSTPAEEPPSPGWAVVLELAGGGALNPVPVVVYETGRGSGVVIGKGLAPGRLELDLSEGAGEKVRFEAEGYWCPDVEKSRLEPPPDGEVTCYREAFLAGRLVTARGVDRPVELLGTAQPSASRTAQDGPFPEEVRFSCPVDAEGSFECHGPAGRFDLRLKAFGFAGQYYWDLRLEPRDRHDVGTLRAVAGASIVGRVESDDGVPFDDGVEVWLEPPTPVPGPLPEEGSLRERRAVVRPGRDGFFQFDGLPPGRVVVSARAPGKVGGDPVAVDLREGLESTLRKPLVLGSPVAVEIQVLPPHDPQAQPWTLFLSRRDRRPGSPRWRGEVANDGTWRQEGFSEGEYILRLESQRGDRWHSEVVDIGSETSTLLVSLDVVHVHGEVVQGGAPVSTHLWFGGRQQTSRVHVFADAEGRFHGYLPRAGLWPVSVQWPEEKGSQSEVGPIEVEEPAAPGEIVEISLELPAGEVLGRVVDEAGDPVQSARVSGFFYGAGSHGFSGTSDEVGEFRAPALTEGRYRFVAALGRSKSSGEEVMIAEGDGPVEVVLVMSSRAVRGRVLSEHGPVLGATVESLPVAVDGSILPSANLSLRSDADGSFEIGLPPEAPELAVVIFPEGFAARALRLPPSEQEVAVQVDGVGGTLVLEPPAGARGQELFGVTLGWNGGWAFLPILKQRWADLHGGSTQWPARLTLPRMEPATYELCSSPYRGGEPAEERCVSGVLSPNGELRLSLAATQP